MKPNRRPHRPYRWRPGKRPGWDPGDLDDPVDPDACGDPTDPDYDPQDPDAIPQPVDQDDPDTPYDQQDLQSEEVHKRYERYLRVKNNTDEMITVFVQANARGEDRSWIWIPADPADSDEALALDVAPGETTFVRISEDDDDFLHARKIRIWADSQSGMQYRKFKNRDFWLVPERDKRNKHYYYATRMGTFTYAFSPE
jgi:hypothetical protein